MKIETWLIANLRNDPENARTHDKKNLDAIANSLKLFGQRKPIVATADGIVLAGNGTLAAAKQIGWTEISVTTTPKEWDYNTARAYALADNRSAELADWDANILANHLVELNSEGWDVNLLGFNVPGMTEDTEEPDAGEVNFDSKYEIVIECETEMAQHELLSRLTQEGLKVRAIIL